MLGCTYTASSPLKVRFWDEQESSAAFEESSHRDRMFPKMCYMCTHWGSNVRDLNNIKRSDKDNIHIHHSRACSRCSHLDTFHHLGTLFLGERVSSAALECVRRSSHSRAGRRCTPQGNSVDDHCSILRWGAGSSHIVHSRARSTSGYLSTTTIRPGTPCQEVGRPLEGRGSFAALECVRRSSHSRAGRTCTPQGNSVDDRCSILRRGAGSSHIVHSRSRSTSGYLSTTTTRPGTLSLKRIQLRTEQQR